jgi:hypothetical protein
MADTTTATEAQKSSAGRAGASGLIWRYWTASTISNRGDAVTTVSLPLVAVEVLRGLPHGGGRRPRMPSGFSLAHEQRSWLSRGRRDLSVRTPASALPTVSRSRADMSPRLRCTCRELREIRDGAAICFRHRIGVVLERRGASAAVPDPRRGVAVVEARSEQLAGGVMPAVLDSESDADRRGGGADRVGCPARSAPGLRFRRCRT